jgi:hypothetical protein
MSNMANILNSNQNFSVTTEYFRLENGKYRGVVVESLIGRFSADSFEIHCENMHASKEEALEDANRFVERRKQGREGRNH